MKALLELEKPCTSAQVIEKFNENKKEPLAATTIRTVLSNLKKKNYIEQVPSMERGHMYRPTKNTQRRSLLDLVTFFFNDKPKEAVSCLLPELDPEELKELEDEIKNVRKRTGGSK